MEAPKHIYDRDVLVSSHTNKPISENPSEPPIFWCAVCRLMLPAAVTAMQHMSGVRHKTKELTYRPGKTSVSESEPIIKKKKEELTETSVITCDDCKMEFSGNVSAIQHFKGKKHAAMVARKMVVEDNSGGPGRGRGQVGRGQAGGQRGMGQAGRGQSGRGQTGGGQPVSGQPGRGGRGQGRGQRGGFTSHGGGVPVGGQFSNFVPAFDDSSSNFAPIGANDNTLRGGMGGRGGRGGGGGGGGGMLRSHLLNAKSRQEQASVGTASFSNHRFPMDNFDNRPFDNIQSSETGTNLGNLPLNRPLQNDRNQLYPDSSNGMLRNEFKDRDTFSGNKPDSFYQNTDRNQRDNFGTNLIGSGQSYGQKNERDDIFRNQTSFRDHPERTDNMIDTKPSLDFPMLSSNLFDKPMSSSDYASKSSPGKYSNVPPPRSDNMQLDRKDYFDRPAPRSLLDDNFSGGNYGNSYSKTQDYGSTGSQSNNYVYVPSPTRNYSSYSNY